MHIHPQFDRKDKDKGVRNHQGEAQDFLKLPLALAIAPGNVRGGCNPNDLIILTEGNACGMQTKRNSITGQTCMGNTSLDMHIHFYMNVKGINTCVKHADASIAHALYIFTCMFETLIYM